MYTYDHPSGTKYGSQEGKKISSFVGQEKQKKSRAGVVVQRQKPGQWGKMIFKGFYSNFHFKVGMLA